MKEMILNIKRVPYSRLTKSEMADYAEKAIDIVDKHDPDLASFYALFELMLKKKSDIELLRLSYGIDEQRLRANKIKAELNLAISVLKLKVSIAKKNKPDLDLHVLENPINKHFRYLYKCRNNHEYNQRIKGFIDLCKIDVDVSQAFSDLDIVHEFDTICALYYKLNHIWDKRVELLSKRPDFTTTMIAKEIKHTANNLFDGIEASYLIGNLTKVEGDPSTESKIDFVSLIDELNQLTGMIRKAINLRDLINQRKRNGEPFRHLLIDDPIVEDDNIIEDE